MYKTTLKTTQLADDRTVDGGVADRLAAVGVER
jgi:hypothetical protein